MGKRIKKRTMQIELESSYIYNNRQQEVNIFKQNEQKI